MRLLFFPLRVREKEGGSPKTTTTTTKALAASGGLSPSFASAWIKADREKEEEDALGEGGKEGARLIG